MRASLLSSDLAILVGRGTNMGFPVVINAQNPLDASRRVGGFGTTSDPKSTCAMYFSYWIGFRYSVPVLHIKFLNEKIKWRILNNSSADLASE
jgi:hypothetical protein